MTLKGCQSRIFGYALTLPGRLVSETDRTCQLELLLLVTLSFVVKAETKLGEGARVEVEISDLYALLMVTASPRHWSTEKTGMTI